MGVRVGVDVGGTFTDAVLIEDDDWSMKREKVLTTSPDQAAGVLTALGRVAGDGAEVTVLHHGYTVGINAALTRTGARAGLLTTAGHRDILDTGRVWRPFDERLYDPTWLRPHEQRPLIERRWRRAIPERLREDGEVLLPLDEGAARREIRFLEREGVESIGICFINGYQHPVHEQRVAKLVQEIMPEIYIQTSQIMPIAREFERSFVVALDVYTGPPVVKYLARLSEGLRDAGLATRVEIMQMNGGVRSMDSVAKAPVYTLQSGPVAGLLGAEFYSRELLGGRDLVCLDIGGTSSDVGVVRNGAAEITNEWELEHAIPLFVSALDVRSIGAGGGSLIQTDEVGSLRVGPQSAGSNPGPACYGLGGTEPTMTDAYVAMGLLQPELFLGSEMRLDRDAAHGALASVARALRMSPVELANGAYEMMNAQLSAVIRTMTTNRGYDPRDLSLLAYGAAGPMHCVPAARELHIPEAVVPYFPGGFSAFGMIASPKRVEYSLAPMAVLEDIGAEGLNAMFRQLEAECLADLLEQGVVTDQVELSYFHRAMYAGQSWDSRLPLPSGRFNQQLVGKAAENFHAFYEWRFGYSAPEVPIIVTSVTVSGQGPRPPVNLVETQSSKGTRLEDAIILKKNVFLDGHLCVDVPFYDRAKCAEGIDIEGPAVIDDRLGTIVINSGAVARADTHGTLRIRV